MTGLLTPLARHLPQIFLIWIRCSERVFERIAEGFLGRKSGHWLGGRTAKPISGRLVRGSGGQERQGWARSLKKGVNGKAFFFQDVAQTAQSIHLDLANALAGNAQFLGNLLQGGVLVAVNAKSALHHLTLLVV